MRTRVYTLTHRHCDAELIFIFGCQRSGTTVTQQLIGLNPSVISYGEGDGPYFYQWPERANRLHDAEVLRLLLAEEKSPRVLLKPLYESQRAAYLLESFENSRAVWVWRNYGDVIASHHSYYRHRDPKKYVAPLLQRDKESWIAEQLTEGFLRLLENLRPDDLSTDDLYGLFWIARSELFWQVENSKRVRLINYDQLVIHPDETIDALYRFLRLDLHPVYSRIVRRDRSRKKEPSLNPLIRDYCDQLSERLTGATEVTGA